MTPIVNGLETEFAGRLAFDRQDANAPEGPALLQAYSVRGHPAYVIVAVDGQMLWQASGQLNAQALRAQVSRYVETAPE